MAEVLLRSEGMYIEKTNLHVTQLMSNSKRCCQATVFYDGATSRGLTHRSQFSKS